MLWILKPVYSVVNFTPPFFDALIFLVTLLFTLTPFFGFDFSFTLTLLAFTFTLSHILLWYLLLFFAFAINSAIFCLYSLIFFYFGTFHFSFLDYSLLPSKYSFSFFSITCGFQIFSPCHLYNYTVCKVF